MGGLVRPIHIGAALVDPKERGPEPDCLTEPNLSTKTAFSDLRMHYYVSRLDLPDNQVIAIMQYRRMFYLKQPGLFDIRGQHLSRRLGNSKKDYARVRVSFRDAYLQELSNLTQNQLAELLGGETAIMSGHRLSLQGLERAYLDTIPDLFPGDDRYLDAWFKMRTLLEERVGKQLVKSVLEGQQGYFHNAMVTTWAEFKSYSEFLFGILDEMPEFHNVPRVLGYLGERIQPVYVRYRQASGPKFTIRHQRIMFFA